MDESQVPIPPARGPLQINSETREGIVTLLLAGELDIASAPELQRAMDDLASTHTERLVIDLGAVTFMDSSGLRTLLLARQRADDGDHELVLRSGSRQVQRVLELSGAIDSFTFER